jgi:hypothetical protein
MKFSICEKNTPKLTNLPVSVFIDRELTLLLSAGLIQLSHRPGLHSSLALGHVLATQESFDLLLESGVAQSRWQSLLGRLR